MTAVRPRQIAFYGKGGIGKSTVVANLSSALAASGHRVLQVGCDPKRDSSRPFWSGRRPRTVLELLGHGTASVADFVHTSESGVAYLEVGGPEPGVGCAGRGILKMFEMVEDAGLLESGAYDVVVYDVLGDVVCGGFAAPLRSGHAEEVYIVLSGEFMAIYAANNLCRGVRNYALRQDVRLGGFVLNCRNVPAERETVEAFAARVGSRVVGTAPRHALVAEAERRRRTVVEAFPDSEQAQVYRDLARTVLEDRRLVVPEPMDDLALEDLYYAGLDAAAGEGG